MDVENIYCNRCGNSLDVVEVVDSEWEDTGKTTYLVCPNCGAQFECTEPGEKFRDKFDFYKDGEPVDERHKGVDLNN